MIHVFDVKTENKVLLIMKDDNKDLNQFLSSNNYSFYDTILSRGEAKSKNVYKKSGKYYVVGKIEQVKSNIYYIIMNDITSSIQNPENRL